MKQIVLNSGLLEALKELKKDNEMESCRITVQRGS